MPGRIILLPIATALAYFTCTFTWAYQFQRLETAGFNTCILPLYNYCPPIKSWPPDPTLPSHPTTREISECSLLCLLDLKCWFFQVVRTEDGRRYCHKFKTVDAFVIANETLCMSFIKREKAVDCIIHWIPDDNRLAKFYGIEKSDGSWVVLDSSRGIHFIELDKDRCAPKTHNSFDTMTGAAEQNRLQNYLNTIIPTGTRLVSYTVGQFMDKNMALFLYKNFKISYGPTDNYSLVIACLKNSTMTCQGMTQWNSHRVFVYLDIAEKKTYVPVTSYLDIFFIMYRNKYSP